MVTSDEIQPNQRAIEIVDDSFHMVRHEMASIPILGTVAAGQPILAQERY